MIAASEPQEFIPSGRQQIKSHPTALLYPQDALSSEEADLSRKLQKVSISDSDIPEKWLLRESPNFYMYKRKQESNYSAADNSKYFNVSDVCTDDTMYVTSQMFVSTQKPVGHNSENTTSKFFKTRSKHSYESDVIDNSKSLSTNFKSRSNLGSGNYANRGELNLKKDISIIEEELYIKGKTVIWSKGLSYNDSASSKICSYTTPNLIRHAIWCTFHLERPDFDLSESPKLEEPTGTPLPSICIIDTQNIRVFAINNEDFISSLPFQVASVWSSKFGILLEKEIIESNNFQQNDTPILFSLTHPLDEMCPVAVRYGNFQLLTDKNIQIVFTNEEPSICMAYNKRTQLHSVYRLRRVKCDEWVNMSDANLNYSNCGQPPPNINISNLLMNRISGKIGHSLGGGGSPYSSRTATPTSLHPSKSHSPMAAISRSNSPGMSPLIAGNPWLKTSHISMTEQAEITQKQVFYHINPELCLDHIWTTNIKFSGAASKVFLTVDFVGQTYLCFLVPSSMQLYLVRYEVTNTNNLIFGMLTNFNAKDAVNLMHIHMLAILEPSGNVVLYSGVTHVGKITNLPQPSQASYSSYKLSKFNSPFPRRSTLLPHYGTPGGMDPQFDEHLLSPVYPANPNKPDVMQQTALSDILIHDTQTFQLIGLRDPVGFYLTLEYSSNTFYRIKLPVIASTSLVQSCLEALRQTLPKEQSITLFTNFYAARNAPGPDDLNLEKEWFTFVDVLFGLLGYNINSLNKSQDVNLETPIGAAKRHRPSATFSDKHWQMLLESEHHENLDEYCSTILGLDCSFFHKEDTAYKNSEINPNASIYTYIKVVHFTLHLIYEELCLNVLRQEELQFLAQFLATLSKDLGLKEYELYYWKLHPNVISLSNEIAQDFPNKSSLVSWPIMKNKVFSAMEFVYQLIQGTKLNSFPYIRCVNPRTRDIILLCSLITSNLHKNFGNLEDLIQLIVPPGTRAELQPYYDLKLIKSEKTSTCHKLVSLITKMGMTRRELDSLPTGINLLLHGTLWQCRENPSSNWTPEAYYLLQRPELASLAQFKTENQKLVSTDLKSGPQPHSLSVFTQFREVLPNVRQLDTEQDDGMENIENRLLRLRFPKDQRVGEVRRLLQSSEPVYIGIPQRPDVSDHDFIEEQEKHLYAICTRTMALPVGRGMFTLRTATPVITETLPIPRLCLSGKAPPRGGSVELSHIDTPPNMNLWPLFHNGVAAGLRISPDAPDIDSTWIIFNKPKSTSETPLEHAGFLMALGLNGHLKNLAVVNMFDYLIKFHEMTSVGLLLGIAATKRGTMDVATTKMLSIHLEALLPPTSMELDISQNLQVAALLGIGLVYQGSAHRHISEVLLAEIGRPPGPEMENSTDRESYSLAAGLALGLVTLCKCDHATGLADLAIPDTLHYYIVGGSNRQWTGSQKDKYKVPSFQIREGSSVNLDITAPGAILALGLMYMGSGNKAVAGWMNPPDTQYLLDFVRPDFLMLQIISRALIMWNDIEPTKDWIQNQVPEAIRPFCLVKPTNDMDTNIDYEAMNQAYSNIIAGGCFAMGLKYAGSANEEAFETLLHYCHMFTSLTGKSIAELAGKPTIEMCLNLILISVSMVMAGTGSLEIMRIIRFLRRRVGVASSTVVTYGSHLAVHMALGLLFLGGGRYTLSNSPPSVAALICAFFPKFPTHSNDNRYHLQAFRHLYVLAVEPRLLIPRDVLTGLMCYANIQVVHLNGNNKTMKGPCLIPDPNDLVSLAVEDDRYWPVIFERGKNWEQLLHILEYGGHVEVKQRAGCMSYLEDPLGWQSELAKTITKSGIVPWEPEPHATSSFSSELSVRFFITNYLTNTTNNATAEMKLLRTLTTLMYDCLTKDKLAVLPLWINLIKIVDNFIHQPSVFQLWQLKFALSQISFQNILIPPDLLLSLKQQTIEILNSWESEIAPYVKKYLKGEDLSNCEIMIHKKLAGYVTYYDIPYNVSNLESNFALLLKLKELNINEESFTKIRNVLMCNYS